MKINLQRFKEVVLNFVAFLMFFYLGCWRILHCRTKESFKNVSVVMKKL